MSKTLVGIFAFSICLEQFFLLSFLPIGVLFFFAIFVTIVALCMMINIFRSPSHSSISHDSNNAPALQEKAEGSFFTCWPRILAPWGQFSQKKDKVVVHFCPNVGVDNNFAEQVVTSFQEYINKNARNYTVECMVGTLDAVIQDAKAIKIILLIGEEFLGRQQRRLETDHLKYAEFASYDHGGSTPNILRFELGVFDPSHRRTQETYRVFKEACDRLVQGPQPPTEDVSKKSYRMP